jgi:hypothetical protein
MAFLTSRCLLQSAMPGDEDAIGTILALPILELGAIDEVSEDRHASGRGSDAAVTADEKVHERCTAYSDCGR